VFDSGRDIGGGALLIGLLATALGIALQRTRTDAGDNQLATSRRLVAAPAILIAVAILVAAHRLRDRPWHGAWSGYGTLAWVGVIFIVIALVIAPLAIRPLAIAGGRRRVALGIALAVTILSGSGAYAFGSADGFFLQLGAGIGPMLAATMFIVLLVPDRTKLGVAVLALSLVMALGLQQVVTDGERGPFQQRALAEQTAPIRIGRAGGEILVAPETARFVSEIRSSADAAGWRSGTPLLDLTRFSPTILYVLEARPPVTILLSVWGNPKTQNDLARWSVDQILANGDGAEWSNAWVLTLDWPETGRVDPAVLGKIGRTFPGDYERVGTFDFTAGGPSTEVIQEKLSLWKPTTVRPSST
jgi:hypothetical protein